MYSEVTVMLGSGTQAMKAMRVLKAAGIPCRMVRTEPDENGHGCGYGVRLGSGHYERAVTVLKRAGVTPDGVTGGAKG